jgi:hypothetical protein
MSVKTRKILAAGFLCAAVPVVWYTVAGGFQMLPSALLWLAKAAGIAVLIGGGFFGSIFATLTMILMIVITPAARSTRQRNDAENVAFWAVTGGYITGLIFGVLLVAAWASGFQW